MTDPLGQSQVLPYIAGLSKRGYEFHLVSFEKMDRFLTHKKHIKQFCNTNDINWHPQDYQISGGLRNTIKQVRHMHKIANFLHKQHDFSIVHCRSYISALAGRRLQKKFGMKFIFDMRGFWADERIDGEIWKLSRPLYKTIYNFFKRKEKEFFSKANYTISLTENGKEEILSWDSFKINPPKIKVIPCCVNLDLFDPSKIKADDQIVLRKSIGIQDDAYVLGYIGSIGTWYMLSEMFDYFRVLRITNPSAVFLFVSGEDPEMIIKQAKNQGVNPANVFIVSTLHQGVPLHISLFTQSIFFIRASYSKKASSPTKQGEIMAMGIPLICNSGVGDTDNIVLKYKSGIVISSFDDTTYQENILSPIDFDKQKVKAGAKDYFSLEQGIQSYLEVYKHVNG